MENKEIVKLIAQNNTRMITIDPDIKSEISRKQLDGIIVDMKKHLHQKKKVHIILVKE